MFPMDRVYALCDLFAVNGPSQKVGIVIICKQTKASVPQIHHPRSTIRGKLNTMGLFVHGNQSQCGFHLITAVYTFIKLSSHSIFSLHIPTCIPHWNTRKKHLYYLSHCFQCSSQRKLWNIFFLTCCVTYCHVFHAESTSGSQDADQPHAMGPICIQSHGKIQSNTSHRYGSDFCKDFHRVFF